MDNTPHTQDSRAELRAKIWDSVRAPMQSFKKAESITDETMAAVDAYVAEQVADQTKNVTRFEVIDHRPIKDEFGLPSVAGRAVVAYGVEIELDYQDDGKTLKVFINDRKTKIPKNKTQKG